MREDGGWEHRACLRSPSPDAREFGWSVDLEGETVVVSDRFDGAGNGSVWSFARGSDGSWIPHEVFRVSAAAEGEIFGAAVAAGHGRPSS